MSIITVYVKAKSKKAINDRLAAEAPLAAGIPVVGTVYNPWSETRVALRDMPSGTVIKVYDKFVAGSPYAKAYGVWDAKKQRIK